MSCTTPFIEDFVLQISPNPVVHTGIAYSVLNIQRENSSFNTIIHYKPTEYLFIYSTVLHTARTAKNPNYIQLLRPEYMCSKNNEFLQKCKEICEYFYSYVFYK